MAIVLLVAMLECERLWADFGPRPQTWQVRDIMGGLLNYKVHDIIGKDF